MDRFIVKEPRVGAGFPQKNEMMACPNGRSMMPLENLYYSGGYLPNNYQNVQKTAVNMNSPYERQPQPQNSPHFGQTQFQANSSYLGETPPHVNSPYPGQSKPQEQTQSFPANSTVPQGHVSGIDPRYLGGYGDASPQYILAGQQVQRNQAINSFGNDYQNRSFSGVDRSKRIHTPQAIQPQVMTLGGLEPARVEEMPKPYTAPEAKISQNQESFQTKFSFSKKPTDLDLIRKDVQLQMMTRSDKLKALHKSGPRAFSGPVEKVLKWHKSLQEVGILIIYEIVGKCVSIRPGEHCAKNLVVRDDNGPAMQVVYYEVDFLLPLLKPPCTVRVVGRMIAGTCRLQAFNVRVATGDDVTTLPRRAAVASHHVAKLSKEYGHSHA